jgi:hypothetical protein
MAEDKKALYSTNFGVFIDTDENVRTEVTVVEVTLTESLLTPGLQTKVKVASKVLMDESKNLNDFYAKNIYIEANRPIINEYFSSSDINWQFKTSQLVYRLSNRENHTYPVETFTLDACDPSLIEDAKTWVSKSWGCTAPSQVVRDVMRQCLNLTSEQMDIENAVKPRPYIAENIHPFQIINQQAEVALNAEKLDPSFVHFMTYQNKDGKHIPTHNFKSLTKMAQKRSMFTFTYSHKAGADANYANPTDIIKYSFPCDFDLLSDTLNGYDENGDNINSLITINPYNASSSIYGKGFTRCGGTSASTVTNKGTAQAQDTCETNVEEHLLKRRPRMSLLEQDKIAIRLTVPFAPFLNAGKMISVKIPNPKNEGFLFGTGDYLIVSMTHKLTHGGYGVTMLDCVANTVAVGVQ